MTEKELMGIAQAEGFTAAMIAPEQVPVDAKFCVFCEQNLCGRYGANYSCPPDCGTPEELREKLLAEKHVLVLTRIWPMNGYEDKAAITYAKREHNAAMLRVMRKLEESGCAGVCTGYNGCSLCEPCKRIENRPCAFPEQRISCMSAYCVDVAELAKRCDLPFAWDEDKLHLFGMIAYHEQETK